MTYRSRYLNLFDAGALIDLVLLDETNPRAVAFQLAAIERNLRELPLITPTQRTGSALRIAGDVRMATTGANAEILAAAREGGKRTVLTALTDKIENAMMHVTDAITDAYFQHSVRRRTGAATPRGSV
jgi:uncharacterized alpha-E superfamily protein